MNTKTPDELMFPVTAGFMVLDGCVLFPGSLLPLFIFEPRYRVMLAKALASDRIFGVTGVCPNTGEPYQSAGIGIIRACVQNEDGTSHLVLQGLERVGVERWVQSEPYRVGSIRKLSSRTPDSSSSERARAALMEICRVLSRSGTPMPSELIHHLSKVQDPGVFADMLASSIIEDSGLRQQLLEELDVEERLRILEETLSESIP